MEDKEKKYLEEAVGYETEGYIPEAKTPVGYTNINSQELMNILKQMKGNSLQLKGTLMSAADGNLIIASTEKQM